MFRHRDGRLGYVPAICRKARLCSGIMPERLGHVPAS